MAQFPAVHPGASLLTAWSSCRPSTSQQLPARRTSLIIGSNSLASARSFACLEAGYSVLVLCAPREEVDEELVWRAERQELSIVVCPALLSGDFGDWLDSQRALLDDIALVFIADTLRTNKHASRSLASALELRQVCFERRLPLNVADHPALCDFAVPASQRLPLLDGKPSSLQIALTTNASACRLASRLRRMLVAALPRGAASAVHRVAELRQAIKAAEVQEESVEEAWSGFELLNSPVEQLPTRRCPSRERGRSRPLLTSVASAPAIIGLDTPPSTPPAHVSALTAKGESNLNALTRMRFIAQICAHEWLSALRLACSSRTAEYWPIDQLARLDEKDAARLLDIRPSALATAADSGASISLPTPPREESLSPSRPTLPSIAESGRADDRSSRDATTARHALELTAPSQVPRRGRIYLVGSGPGSPALLTCAARDILTRYATIVLSDKLVPAPVLALIPKTTKLVIAQKFPGNAEGAQDELMRLGIEALHRGETVVRLKQGDPLLYGRGGEEILFFRKHGYESIVIPGVTSALAAPLLAGIPVTQRGVADSLALATGVGRAGAAASLPTYERRRTLVLLMSLARIDHLVSNLLAAGYPPHLPCATIERASSPDQRCIAATLETIASALSRVEQRPPGLLVVGWCVLALTDDGDMTVLDDAATDKDEARIKRWLNGRPCIMTEGLPEGWRELVEENEVLTA